jgi:hypothetical protein
MFLYFSDRFLAFLVYAGMALALIIAYRQKSKITLIAGLIICAVLILGQTVLLIQDINSLLYRPAGVEEAGRMLYQEENPDWWVGE